ncbi:hypothetical protein LOC08_07935, partial [Lactobacillus delbrueckii subsp. lactis]|uniref:hypothetical protein n=1 Tax=Lactobacillus delbrueckii TaxID=1584 RepID=UPI001E403815
SDGEYYFHGFDIMVNGSKRFVLRYNSGNIDVTEKELRAAVNYFQTVSIISMDLTLWLTVVKGLFYGITAEILM